jgi:hypothetical protein
VGHGFEVPLESSRLIGVENAPTPKAVNELFPNMPRCPKR